MSTALATGWPPESVWRLTRLESEEANAAALRRSGRPYRRPLTESERAQKAAYQATAKRVA